MKIGRSTLPGFVRLEVSQIKANMVSQWPEKCRGLIAPTLPIPTIFKLLTTLQLCSLLIGSNLFGLGSF